MPQERIPPLLPPIEKLPKANHIGLVYFIQPENIFKVKIGWTTNLRKRLAGLQVSAWEKLLVVGYDMPAERHVEAQMHKWFQKDRLHGEWFRYSYDLYQYIKNATRGATPG